MANTYWGGMRMSGNGGGGGGSINTTQLTQSILDGVEEIVRPHAYVPSSPTLYPKAVLLKFVTPFPLNNADNLYSFEHLNVSALQSMASMFVSTCPSYSSGLSIDLTDWDVSNVESMEQMFQNNTFTPNSVDMSNWDTRRLTSMYRVFYSANFNPIVANWSVSHILNFSECFRSCTAVELDLSTWDMSHATNFSGMFTYTGNLTKLLWGGAINIGDNGIYPALDLSNTILTPANADLFFQSLGTKTYSGTTTINMPTTAQGADISIAEAKGYTISNITQP